MKIGEFFVQLGVLSDKKNVAEFAGSLKNVTLDAALAVAGLIGVEYQLAKVAGEAMNAAVGFEMFSAQTGLSWQELQRWQIAGAQVNVTAENIASSISQLEKNLAALRLGHGNRAPFQMLGLSTNQDAFGVLSQLRNRVQALHLDRATASNMISEMGISPDMIRLLYLTDAEFNRLSHTIHGMTTGQEQQFYRSKQALIEWGLALKQYGYDGVSHLLNVLDVLAGFFRNMQVWWPGVITSVLALGIAFAPVTTAIAGLLLLLDDLAVYSQGGDSLFGAFAKFFDNQVKGPAAAAGGFLNDNLPPWLTNFLATAGSNLAGSPLPAATAKAITQTNTFNITGSDPKSIAAEVRHALRMEMSQAEEQVNNQGH